MPPKITHKRYKEEFDKKFKGILELRDSKYVSARDKITVYCLKHDNRSNTYKVSQFDR